MAINLNGFPYDSQIIGYGVDGLPEYDRASNSEEFASLLRSFWRDGVFGESALTVLAGSGMTVTVGTGSVLIQGRVAQVTSAKTLTFDTADSQPRFDRVVARSDLSNSVRDIVLDVVKGMPASSPVAPALTRNQSKWELCLATVRIPANISVIQQSNITDTRLDSELCGLVAATMTDVDTTVFYEQIQSDLEGFREVEQNQFLEWFDSIRDVLDENAAGNLYNKIENLTAADVGAVSSVNGKQPDAAGDVTIDFKDIGLGYENRADNSNFRQFVGQAEVGGVHGTQAYAGDRWKLISGTITGTKNSNGNGYRSITLNGTIRQVVANPEANMTAFVGTISGTATASYADGELTITSNGGVLDWVLLLPGTWEKKPQYVPKGYAVELAECRLYFRPRTEIPLFAYTAGSLMGFSFEPMRNRPTIIGTVNHNFNSDLSIGGDTSVFLYAGNNYTVQRVSNDNIVQGTHYRFAAEFHNDL